MSISSKSTVQDLINLGIIKSSQIEAWNNKLNRQTEKQADSLSQDRCDQAVAYYIGMTYQPGERFRKKPIEKALLSSGISRAMMDKSIKRLVEEGILENNADEVANQTHTRHWIPEAE